MSNKIWERIREETEKEEKQKTTTLKDRVLNLMPSRNHKGDKSFCIGTFTLDYSKEEDKFYLVYPEGRVKEITLETAAKYIGLGEQK
jgi:hypothetical protein